MSVGENIKKIRKEKGLTQKKLGELSGINEVQIRQYELGNANPKIETLEKIANALQVNTMVFYGTYPPVSHDDIQLKTTAFYATIKLLECVYNRAESVSTNAYKDNVFAYSSNYISIGTDNKIAISNNDFDKIVEYVQSYISNLIGLVGENELTFLKNWESEPDIDDLVLEENEHVKILLEDENYVPISYLKPF